MSLKVPHKPKPIKKKKIKLNTNYYSSYYEPWNLVVNFKEVKKRHLGNLFVETLFLLVWYPLKEPEPVPTLI